ncbi:unnamed protein product [Echinostoma caproni]|uniref:Uncharacterized protein n=1 Tax=Echinostoma caproni TaxID=27848 RepID=A0A183B197_9TREM|nr:unnamed protein product [Echinostoma caproni]
MDNLKAFFTNLSKTGRKPLAEQKSASNVDLPSAVLPEKSILRSTKPEERPHEVRFQTTEAVPDKRELVEPNTDQGSAKLTPQLTRLIDQIRNRTVRTGNETEDQDDIKQRLSRSMNNLDNLSQQLIPKNGDITEQQIPINNPLSRTHSEGQNVKAETPPISEQIARVVTEEPVETTSVQKMEQSQTDRDKTEATAVFSNQQTHFSNRTEVPQLELVKPKISPRSGGSQEEFEQIYETNRNRLEVSLFVSLYGCW